LTIADAAYSPPSGTQEVLVLPLGEHAVACATRGERIPNRPIRLGGAGGVKPPRKVRDVPPIYPKELVQRGVEGLVTVESTIAETGCVSGAKIVRSVHPQLDLAAIVAVSGWEFTPTMVDGRSMPVAMSVSVNFTTK
jgi:TonB family protein